MTPLVERARQAREAVRAAEIAYEEALAAAYPPQSRATYSLGLHRVSVKVLDHSGDQLRVLNEATGKVYWVYGYRFHGYR